MAKAAYSFLPWLRQGLANRLTLVDQLGANTGSSTDDNASIKVSVQVKGDGQLVADGEIQKTIHLYGPGDVIGVESAAVIKTQPRRSTVDFEPNYLPYIEFYAEDFPWRYTPLKNQGDRLRPWMMLVVLEAGDFERSNVQKGDVLPSIILKSKAVDVFPPADQIWAWAHVHVNQSLGLEDIYPKDVATQNRAVQTLGKLIQSDPNRSCSRILCPIKLKPQTEYFAFLIPSFERGRLAGLGRKYADISAVSIQMPAWGQSPDQTQFPYYFDWTFRTGDATDFEELVRKIEPRQLNERVGKRWIDIQDPGYNIHYQTSSPQEGVFIQQRTDPEGQVVDYEVDIIREGALLMEGALRIPDTELPSLLSDQIDKDATWIDHVQGILNLEADMRERKVGKDHHYAQNPYFQTETEEKSEEEKAPIYDDPIILPPIYGRWHAARDRVDQENPDHWLNSLNLDPRHRIAAGFGAEAVRRNQEDYMDRAWQQFESLFEANDYLRKMEFSMAVTEGFVAKHFRKMQSWQLTSISEGVQNVVQTESRTTLKAYIHPRSVPNALLTAASEKVAHPNRMLMRRVRKRSGQSGGSHTQRSKPTGSGYALPQIDEVSLKPVKATVILPKAFNFPIPSGGNLVHQSLKGFMGLGQLVKKALENKRRRKRFRNNYLLISGVEGSITHFYEALEQLDSQTSFKDDELIDDTSSKLTFQTTSTHILNAIQPDVAFGKKVGSALQIIDTDGKSRSMERLQPVMQAPEFPDAMYEALEAIAADHLVPNLDLIPPNTYSLMETNRAFIEAYMVGVNYEMARELIWREFPTDQRGSYFRRFWASRDGASSLSVKPDIAPIHQWQHALGKHPALSNPVGTEQRLVLVIRADLIRKYPNVVVYMHKAKKVTVTDPETGQRVRKRVPGTRINYPAFFAQVQPDIYFVGFNMTVKEARRGQGYYFMIRERPGEVRFGMDLPSVEDLGTAAIQPWDDLDWAELTGMHRCIDLAQDTPQNKPDRKTVPWPTTTTGHAAQMAWILQQKPVLVAVHIETILAAPSTTIPAQ